MSWNDILTALDSHQQQRLMSLPCSLISSESQINDAFSLSCLKYFEGQLPLL